MTRTDKLARGALALTALVGVVAWAIDLNPAYVMILIASIWVLAIFAVPKGCAVCGTELLGVSHSLGEGKRICPRCHGIGASLDKSSVSH